MSKIEPLRDKFGKPYVSLGTIFSVGETTDNQVWIEKNCDNYFSLIMTKEQAIKIFEDILEFVKSL